MDRFIPDLGHGMLAHVVSEVWVCGCKSRCDASMLRQAIYLWRFAGSAAQVQVAILLHISLGRLNRASDGGSAARHSGGRRAGLQQSYHRDRALAEPLAFSGTAIRLAMRSDP